MAKEDKIIFYGLWFSDSHAVAMQIPTAYAFLRTGIGARNCASRWKVSLMMIPQTILQQTRLLFIHVRVSDKSHKWNMD